MEFLDLPAARCASGTVTLPGSKSISNRTLLLAALSKGQTLIHDLLASDDTDRMLEALNTLGVQVEQLTLSNTASPAAAGSSRLNMPIYSSATQAPPFVPSPPPSPLAAAPIRCAAYRVCTSGRLAI